MENYTLTYQLQQIIPGNLVIKPGRLYEEVQTSFRAKNQEEAEDYAKQKLLDVQGIGASENPTKYSKYDFQNIELDVQTAFASIQKEGGEEIVIVRRSSSSIDAKVA